MGNEVKPTKPVKEKSWFLKCPACGVWATEVTKAQLQDISSVICAGCFHSGFRVLVLGNGAGWVLARPDWR